MTKILIILILLLVLAAFVAVRFRKQIKTALYVWKMFKQMREMGKSGGSSEREIQGKTSKRAAAEELVRCAKCGKWIPKGTSMNLRSKIFYCSAACMEKAVEAPR